MCRPTKTAEIILVFFICSFQYLFTYGSNDSNIDIDSIEAVLLDLNQQRDQFNLGYQDGLESYSSLLGEIIKTDQPVIQASVLYHLGVLQTHFDQYDKAIESFKNAISTLKKHEIEDIIIVKAFSNLTAIYIIRNQLLKAKYSIQKAKSYYIEDYGLLIKSGIEINLATTLKDIGDIEEANLVANNLKGVLSNDKDSDAYGYYYAKTLKVLGDIYEHMEVPDSAIYYYKETLRILDASEFPQDIYPEDISINVVNATEQLGDEAQFLEAINNYENSIKIIKNVLLDVGYWDYYYGLLLNMKGNYFAKIKDYNKAIQLLNSSNSFLLASGEDQYQYDDNIATVYYEVKDFSNAIKHYHTALQIIDSTYKGSNILEAPDFLKNNLQVAFFTDAAEILDSKSKTLLQLYKQNSDIKYLNAAIEHYQSLDDFYNYMLQYMVSEASKLKLIKDAKQTYENAIEACYLGCQELNKVEYVDQAQYFFERSKSVLLQKSLLHLNAQQFIPNQVKDSLKALKYIVFFGEDFDERQEAKLSLQQLEEKLKQDYPSYKNTQSKAQHLTINEVQDSVLEVNQSVIQFFEGEKMIYRLSISKEDFQFRQIRKRAEFENQLTSIYKLISNSKYKKTDFDEITAIGFELYDYLFPKNWIDKKHTRLLIVPDGLMALIPFDVYSFSENDSLDFIEQKLISKYSIGTAYSLQTYQYKNQKVKKKAAVFIPDYKDSPFVELSEAKKDRRNFGRHFKSRAYKGSKANKENFLEESNKYGIILFSGHGQANLESYMETSLITDPLSKNPHCTLKEIYANGGLEGQLIHVSACESGYGDDSPGEGIMSADRVFKSIGMESMVVSRWLASDLSSMEISKKFYQYLADGMFKDEALRQAKLDFLNEYGPQLDRNKHPFFWAGTICIGNQDPIVFEKKLPFKSMILAILSLLLIIGIVVKVKN